MIDCVGQEMDLKYFDFYKEIRSLLRYHRSIGIVEYHQNEQVKGLLRLDSGSAERSGGQQKQQNKKTEHPSRFPEKKKNRAVQVQRATTELVELNDEVADCSICDLASQRLFPSIGQGSVQARLFIVGEWLALRVGAENDSKFIFGEEEDLMLSRMISAINLQSSETFITNLVKCGLAGATTPTRQNFQACLSYLYRQINLVQPDVICAMGPTVAQLLLRSNRSLSQLRGRFHFYEEAGTGKIPLMATYHPSYLLKNEEMKKLTWLDLQAIGKKLQEKR